MNRMKYVRTDRIWIDKASNFIILAQYEGQIEKKRAGFERNKKYKNIMLFTLFLTFAIVFNFIFLTPIERHHGSISVATTFRNHNLNASGTAAINNFSCN